MIKGSLIDGTGDCVILERVETHPDYDIGDAPRAGWYLVQVAGEMAPRLIPECLVRVAGLSTTNRRRQTGRKE